MKKTMARSCGEKSLKIWCLFRQTDVSAGLGLNSLKIILFCLCQSPVKFKTVGGSKINTGCLAKLKNDESWNAMISFPIVYSADIYDRQ